MLFVQNLEKEAFNEPIIGTNEIERNDAVDKTKNATNDSIALNDGVNGAIDNNVYISNYNEKSTQIKKWMHQTLPLKEKTHQST